MTTPSSECIGLSTILRHVEPTTKQQTSVSKPLTKNAQRAAKFRIIGQLVTRLGDPELAKDYGTGREFGYTPQRADNRNRDTEDPLNKDKTDKTEIPYGPRFATPQWVKTLR